jgi:hypothetical protein
MKRNQFLIAVGKAIAIAAFAIFTGGMLGKAQEDSKLLVHVDRAVVSPIIVEQPTANLDLVTLLPDLLTNQLISVQTPITLKSDVFYRRTLSSITKKTTIENRRRAPITFGPTIREVSRGDDLELNTS